MGRFAEPSDLAVALEGVEVLEMLASDRQRLQLLLHPKLGRALVIDDVLQHVEAWQALYHEPLVHLPAAFVGEVRNALILGGGSLFAAREALRYRTLTSCTLVDHDPAVLELMGRHYPHARDVLADPRFHYVQADAWSFVEACTEKFDLVLNDALDLLRAPAGTAFKSLATLLRPAGVAGDVIYRHLLAGGDVEASRRAIDEIGPSALSLVVVPEYPGTLHALTIWGNRQVSQQARQPINLLQQGWCVGDEKPNLEFYDPRSLSFHLYLPPFLRRQWQG